MEYFTSIVEGNTYQAANGLKTIKIEHYAGFGYMITFENNERFQMASLISPTNPYRLVKKVTENITFKRNNVVIGQTYDCREKGLKGTVTGLVLGTTDDYMVRYSNGEICTVNSKGEMFDNQENLYDLLPTIVNISSINTINFD